MNINSRLILSILTRYVEVIANSRKCSGSDDGRVKGDPQLPGDFSCQCRFIDQKQRLSLSLMLEHLFESVFERTSQNTVFDATGIEVFKSLSDYIDRCFRYVSGTVEQHALTLYLIDLLLAKANMSKHHVPKIYLTRRNVQRVFIVATGISQKFLDEENFYSNLRYAKIAGIPLAEMNAMERYFLQMIEFGVNPAQQAYEQYVHALHFLSGTTVEELRAVRSVSVSQQGFWDADVLTLSTPTSSPPFSPSESGEDAVLPLHEQLDLSCDRLDREYGMREFQRCTELFSREQSFARLQLDLSGKAEMEFRPDKKIKL